MSGLVGQTLGPYRIVEQLGVGGMATVYKAYQPAMERYVALKVPSNHLLEDEEFRARFAREARTIAQLEHPYILPVHDFGEDQGIPYLVMRYVDAGTLRDLTARGPVPLERAARLVAEVAEALDYAHRKGVVHRDVKPPNVLLDHDGSALLTDFGIAKLVEQTMLLTHTGVAMGTPYYMAPEQVTGKPVDGRTDIYALGVILYELFVGRRPFEGDTPLAVAFKHVSDPLPLPRQVRPSLSEEAERIILRAMAREPADRYPRAGDLAADLHRLALSAAPTSSVAEKIVAIPGAPTTGALPPRSGLAAMTVSSPAQDTLAKTELLTNPDLAAMPASRGTAVTPLPDPVAGSACRSPSNSFLSRRKVIGSAAALGLVGAAVALWSKSVPSSSLLPPAPSGAPTVESAATGSAPTAVSATTEGPRATATATPVPQLAANQSAVLPSSLRLPIGTINTVDPARGSMPDAAVTLRVFSNLYTFDARGGLVPDQAAALPQVSSDGKTITVKLKPNLTFADGHPLTAKDFKFGTLRQLNPSVFSPYAFTLIPISGAAAYHVANPKTLSVEELARLRDAVGIDTPDDTTIVYQLDNPTPWFPSILGTWNGLPLQESLVTANGTRTEDNVEWTSHASTYVGNGPYRMTRFDPNVAYEFVANEKYVQGAPPIATVSCQTMRDTASEISAYKAGNLDVANVAPGTRPTVDENDALKQQLSVVPANATFFIGFNTTVKPFDNLKVRQAFAAAFDRKTFVAESLRGLGFVPDQLVPPGLPGHYAGVSPQTFDPVKAKQLLSDAGFPGGQGLPPIQLTFLNDVSIYTLMANFAQRTFLQVLGVKVSLDSIDPRSFSLASPTSTPQLYCFLRRLEYPDPEDWYSALFQTGGRANHTYWQNAPFDQLTRQADRDPDLARRDNLYKQAAEILNREAPVIFTHDEVSARLIKPALPGYQEDPFEYYFGQHILNSRAAAT